MTDARARPGAGTSPAAIARHYDVSDEFFALWLGDDLVYSCALWDPDDPADALRAAQERKLDHFARRLAVRGARVLDVGCGWGALLDRCVRVHDAAGGVGLTLSAAQQRHAAARGVPGVDYRLESWTDHEPTARYDAITCIEATEHFASDRLDPDEKAAVYAAFFERCADWLHDGGRVGLQLICLDNAGHEASRPGRGPASELIRVDVFPESMPASLSELVLGWESCFELEQFLVHPDHYRRTFRAWALAYRAAQARAHELVGPGTARTFERYFAAGEAFFRLREHALYRVVLRKRPAPKAWATPLPAGAPAADPLPGASVEAVRSHYDVSNEFYRLWLGPTMMYSSGMWGPTDDPADLEAALLRKLDHFAAAALRAPGGRALDVGCGWGGTLERLVTAHGVASGVGLTLSAAQHELAAARPVPGVEVRVEAWSEHVPAEPYDAVFSYGAFEHFARDGTTRAQRIAVYRAFFARCFEWLSPDGRLALETIAHESAPDTASPLGRGPLGDFVLGLYPESICPHLHEIVLGFEPWFEIEELRSGAADFARTARLWSLRLREREREAAALVGPEVARRFARYLVSTEVQFRIGLLTNYRFVLHRRPAARW
ncbi:MAG: class I SAM-dependent methyltransferase [Frankiaceae bacterium]